MTYNRLHTLFFIITSLTMICLIAMDGHNVPTVIFKNKSLQELNEFAIVNEVLALTPRSKQSLQERLKDLGITIDSGELIYTALTADGTAPARPGDVIKFVATKQYYSQHKQMPSDNYRPRFMLLAKNREELESTLNSLFGPNGFSCVYPDLPTVTYGPGVMQDTEEDFGLRSLFQESCSLK